MTRIEPLGEARGAAGRVWQLLAEQDEALARRTDRLFAPLLVLQWVVTGTVAVVRALPDAGVILAVGAVVALPAAALAWRRAGAPSTRVAVALAQSAASALLIHASGGRIEAHFHIFGSLAFLSLYRDWRLLVLATAVATVDHALRGAWLPWSVFGVHHASYWRVVEHAAWMLFETAILSVAIRQSRAEMREIAERRASLERSHAEVERQVHERTAEIEAARDKAIEAADLKAAFLANMSHEIRTPLNAVIGMTGLLLDTTLSREQREYASVARASGESLLGIINDILDLSKLEAGKLLLEPAECDPRDLVEGVLDLVAEAAHTKGVELASFVDAGVPVGVVTDARRVRQVLLNLVSNAVKFTDRGDVSVRVALMDGGGDDAPTVLAFHVRDTGIGIAPETAARLFQPFAQADASTTRRFGGTGLGLSISKGLVAMMGGEIAVESRFGEGSEFRFTVPVATVPALGTPPALPRPLRVLSVDDNATCLAMLCQQLTRLGATWETAADAAAAIALVERRGTAFDMAILDTRLPDADGETLARRIRQSPHGAHLPILLLTHVHNRPRLPALVGGPPVGLLAKPTKLQRLSEAITAAVAGVPAATPGAPVAAMVPQATSRLLIVDDNAINLRVAVKMVQKLGYQADVAANGIEALEALAHASYAAVLMDCHMPAMDGFEATRIIRSREAGEARRLPIIAVTASAMAEDRQACFEAGMDDYVSKPIELERLRVALERGMTSAA